MARLWSVHLTRSFLRESPTHPRLCTSDRPLKLKTSLDLPASTYFKQIAPSCKVKGEVVPVLNYVPCHEDVLRD
jgi:hypothetical protein